MTVSLRHALLALLTTQSMTGYDLCKSFRSSVGFVWHAPDSQIYPELRKMEDLGLVSSAPVPWGPTTTKREYTITDAGAQVFRDWMNTTLEYSRERDPVHLKAAYFEWAAPEAARDQLLAHIDYYAARRDQWREMIAEIQDHSQPTLARRLEHFPEEAWAAITDFKVFSYEGLVAQAEQQIAWAERGLGLIDRLHADHPDAAIVTDVPSLKPDAQV